MISNVYARHTIQLPRHLMVLQKNVVSIVGASLFSVSLLLASSGGVLAGPSVGEATKIKNHVTGSSGNRKLNVADNVFASENIRAAKDSNGQLLLNDNSKIIVGENSSVSLDNFVVSNDGISKGTFKVTKGALRLISGNGPKGRYKIKTPVSTIGVRGTALDVFVRASGETDVILYNGIIETCSSSTCLVSRRVCDVINIKPSGAISKLPSFRKRRSQEEGENVRFSAMWPQKSFAKSHQVKEWVCRINAVNEFLERRANEPRGDDKDDSPTREPTSDPSPTSEPVGDTGTAPTSDPYSDSKDGGT